MKLKKRLPDKKVSVTYDRGYNSFELMFTHLDLDIDFLIRLKDSTLHKQIEQQTSSDDEIIRLFLNKKITNAITNDELRKKIRKRKIRRFKTNPSISTSSKRKTIHKNITIHIFHGQILQKRHWKSQRLKMDNKNRLRPLKKYPRTRKLHRTKKNHNRTRHILKNIPPKPTANNQKRRRQRCTRKTKRQKPKTRVQMQSKSLTGNITNVPIPFNQLQNRTRTTENNESHNLTGQPKTSTKRR